jgi:hypothetical protein
VAGKLKKPPLPVFASYVIGARRATPSGTYARSLSCHVDTGFRCGVMSRPC